MKAEGAPRRSMWLVLSGVLVLLLAVVITPAQQITETRDSEADPG